MRFGGPLLLVTLVAVGCGDAGTTTTGATGSTFPSVGTLVPRPLEPGAYATSVMTPALTLEVGEGWVQLGEFAPLLIMSQVVGPTRQADFLNFVTFPDTDPAAVVDTIRGVPGVTATELAETTLAGRDAVAFTAEVALRGGAEIEVFEFPNNALYNQVPVDPPRFADGDRMRFTVADVGDDVLVVLAGTSASVDYDAFLAAADEVLATLTIG